MVECTALEMRHTGNRIGGSNPSLSANFVDKLLNLLGLQTLLSGACCKSPEAGNTTSHTRRAGVAEASGDVDGSR